MKLSKAVELFLLLRSGADIRVELLAHEDIKSAMLYTEVAPPDRAKAVLRLPWRVGRGTV